MSNLRLAPMTSWVEAMAYLNGSYGPKKIGHNTYLRRIGGAMVVRYRETDIVTYLPGGSIEIDHGGWATPTTVNRLNILTPNGIRFNHRWTRSPYSAWVLVTVNGETQELVRNAILKPVNA